MNDFIGLKLVGKYGEVGSSTSTYGTDGKFKVDFPGGLRGATVGGQLALTFWKVKGGEKDSSDSKGGAIAGIRQEFLTADAYANRKGIANVEQPKGEKSGSSNDNNNAAAATPPLPPPPAAAIVLVGKIEKLKEEDKTCIISGLFNPEDDMKLFIGRNISAKSQENVIGEISGPFGKGGKCKVKLADAIFGT